MDDERAVIQAREAYLIGGLLGAHQRIQQGMDGWAGTDGVAEGFENGPPHVFPAFEVNDEPFDGAQFEIDAPEFEAGLLDQSGAVVDLAQRVEKLIFAVGLEPGDTGLDLGAQLLELTGGKRHGLPEAGYFGRDLLHGLLQFSGLLAQGLDSLDELFHDTGASTIRVACSREKKALLGGWRRFPLLEHLVELLQERLLVREHFLG